MALSAAARLAVTALLLGGCATGAPSRSSGTLRDERGTIREVGSGAGQFGIVPDFDTGTRFAPDRLPDEFKTDGLRVIFSGRVGEIPPNVRMWGTPLELTGIRRE